MVKGGGGRTADQNESENAAECKGLCVRAWFELLVEHTQLARHIAHGSKSHAYLCNVSHVQDSVLSHSKGLPAF